MGPRLSHIDRRIGCLVRDRRGLEGREGGDVDRWTTMVADSDLHLVEVSVSSSSSSSSPSSSASAANGQKVTYLGNNQVGKTDEVLHPYPTLSEVVVPG